MSNTEDWGKTLGAARDHGRDAEYAKWVTAMQPVAAMLGEPSLRHYPELLSQRLCAALASVEGAKILTLFADDEFCQQVSLRVFEHALRNCSHGFAARTASKALVELRDYYAK